MKIVGWLLLVLGLLFLALCAFFLLVGGYISYGSILAGVGWLLFASLGSILLSLAYRKQPSRQPLPSHNKQVQQAQPKDAAKAAQAQTQGETPTQPEGGSSEPAPIPRQTSLKKGLFEK